MHDYACFIVPIGYCVELSLVHETLSKTVDFSLIPLGKCAWVEESYANMQKNPDF